MREGRNTQTLKMMCKLACDLFHDGRTFDESESSAYPTSKPQSNDSISYMP